MNNYRTHFWFSEYPWKGNMAFNDFEDDAWEHREPPYSEPGWGWYAAQTGAFRTLPWIGAIFIGLGLLIILFPMLLVIAVAGLFFVVGVTCFSLWWQVRDRVQIGRRIRIGAPWWERVKQWVRSSLD